MILADILPRIVKEEEELHQSNQAVVVESNLEEVEVHSVLLEDRMLEDTLEGSHNQDLEEVEVRSRQDMLFERNEQSLHCFSASCWAEDQKDNQSKLMGEVVHIQDDCSSLDRMRWELEGILGVERLEDSHTHEGEEDSTPLSEERVSRLNTLTASYALRD